MITLALVCIGMHAALELLATAAHASDRETGSAVGCALVCAVDAVVFVLVLTRRP